MCHLVFVAIHADVLLTNCICRIQQYVLSWVHFLEARQCAGYVIQLIEKESSRVDMLNIH